MLVIGQQIKKYRGKVRLRVSFNTPVRQRVRLNTPEGRNRRKSWPYLFTTKAEEMRTSRLSFVCVLQFIHDTYAPTHVQTLTKVSTYILFKGGPQGIQQAMTMLNFKTPPQLSSKRPKSWFKSGGCSQRPKGSNHYTNNIPALALPT